MMTEEDILKLLNRLARERPQLNFDSEHARRQIARILYFDSVNKSNVQLARDELSECDYY